MAKPKVWYKHIKPGDVVEVKLAPDHIWKYKYPDTNAIVYVTEVTHNRIFGKHYVDNNVTSYNILVAWDEHDTNLELHQGTIIRKIKKLSEGEN